MNCESDFVARTDDFNNLVKDVAMHIAAASPKWVRREDAGRRRRRMWDNVADLFEVDATLDIAGVGQWHGAKSIRRGLEREGPAGLPAGELNEHVQFPTFITMSPDGVDARARGVELAMTGRNDGKGYWAVLRLREPLSQTGWHLANRADAAVPTMRADYAEGWGKSRLDPVAPDAAQAPDRSSALPRDSLPAFSWRHPVTGKPIRYPDGTRVAGEFPTFARPATLPSASGSTAQRIADGERKQRQLVADVGARRRLERLRQLHRRLRMGAARPAVRAPGRARDAVRRLLHPGRSGSVKPRSRSGVIADRPARAFPFTCASSP